jgi:hypothetical protein
MKLMLFLTSNFLREGVERVLEGDNGRPWRTSGADPGATNPGGPPRSTPWSPDRRGRVTDFPLKVWTSRPQILA